MAINQTSTSGHTAYDLRSFVVDTVADIDNLPIGIPMGSTAFVIEDSSVYMLNGNEEWKEI